MDSENEKGDERAGSRISNKFRFTTFHLFYLVALISAAFALFEIYAFVWLLGVCVFWFLTWCWAMSGAKRLDFLIAALFALLFLTCLGSPNVQQVREAARRTVCANHVRQLILSLLNYQSARLRFPPAYTVDQDGSRMHSWRVLIAPELEMQSFSSQYDFAEAWDGPANCKLLDQISSVYFCPSKKNEKFETPYKLVTGKGTAFEADQSVAIPQFQSLGNTIAIIEDTSSPICWMEPQDLIVDQVVQLFDEDYVRHHPGHVVETNFSRTYYFHRHIGLFDGTVLHVGYLEDPQQIVPYLMLNHPDKKSIDDLEFVYPERVHTVLYRGYFLVTINVVLALLPCFVPWLRPLVKENM